MHILEDHVVPWFEWWHLGLGKMGEQGAESVLAHLMKLETTCQGIANDGECLKYIFKEDMLESSLSLVSLRPPAKKRKKSDTNWTISISSCAVHPHTPLSLSLSLSLSVSSTSGRIFPHYPYSEIWLTLTHIKINTTIPNICCKSGQVYLILTVFARTWSTSGVLIEPWTY